MNLSTRTRYGLRAMLELAQRSGEGPVSMESIAKKQALSRRYLHALLTTLRKAGLVESVRGIAGGFVLARPPAEISIGEIVRTLEGPLELVPCLEKRSACPRSQACAARGIWVKMAGAMEDQLNSTSLGALAAGEDLAGEKKRGKSRRSPPAPIRRRRG